MWTLIIHITLILKSLKLFSKSKTQDDFYYLSKSILDLNCSTNNIIIYLVNRQNKFENYWIIWNNYQQIKYIISLVHIKKNYWLYYLVNQFMICFIILSSELFRSEDISQTTSY